MRCSPNAMSYGKSDRPIEVSAARDDSTLIISVADRGIGLEPGEETQVLQKFYRGPRTGPVVSASVCRLRGNWPRRMAARSLRRTAGGRCGVPIRLPIGETMQLPGAKSVATDVSPKKLLRRRYPPFSQQRRICSSIINIGRPNHEGQVNAGCCGLFSRRELQGA